MVSLQSQRASTYRRMKIGARVTGTVWSTKRYGLTAAPGTIVCKILNDR
jgi:hypothetical protein